MILKTNQIFNAASESPPRHRRDVSASKACDNWHSPAIHFHAKALNPARSAATKEGNNWFSPCVLLEVVCCKGWLRGCSLLQPRAEIIIIIKERGDTSSAVLQPAAVAKDLVFFKNARWWLEILKAAHSLACDAEPRHRFRSSASTWTPAKVSRAHGVSPHVGLRKHLFYFLSLPQSTWANRSTEESYTLPLLAKAKEGFVVWLKKLFALASALWQRSVRTHICNYAERNTQGQTRTRMHTHTGDSRHGCVLDTTWKSPVK